MLCPFYAPGGVGLKMLVSLLKESDIEVRAAKVFMEYSDRLVLGGLSLGSREQATVVAFLAYYFWRRSN